jgi:hypothetical protein
MVNSVSRRFYSICFSGVCKAALFGENNFADTLLHCWVDNLSIVLFVFWFRSLIGGIGACVGDIDVELSFLSFSPHSLFYS